MIVLKDNQKLYPATWEYNAARVTSALAAIVEKHGGRVKYGNRAIIQNRSIMGAIREKEERAEKLKKTTYGDAEKRAAYIRKLEEELEELRALNNAPVTVTHAGYITFTLDGYYYYYQVDANPFFPFHFIKTQIIDGTRSRDAVCEEDAKTWLFDCFFSWKCDENEIKRGAEMILEMLRGAKCSEIRRDRVRELVPNRYDGGSHYETITRPERREKIDF